MFLLLLACQEPAEDTEAATTSEVMAPIVVTLDPPTVDFGTVAIGTPVSTEIRVTNAGTGPITLSGATTSSEDVVIDVRSNTLLGPGLSETVVVTWTPTAPAVIEDTLQVLVSDTSGAFTQVPDPITGTAAGPMMTVSTESADFGLVKVGCTTTVPIVITNTGNGDLVLDSAVLANLDDVTITTTDGATPTFPWTLVPYGTATLNLTWAPLDEVSYGNVLRITSDDPTSPELDLALYGEAIVEEAGSVTFDVEPKHNITALFAVNEVVGAEMGMYHERFVDALPVFFDALVDYGAPFRFALTMQIDGSVRGDVRYIDETFSTTELGSLIEDMAATGMGDNDYLLQALLSGIEDEDNAAWLFEPGWEDSRLSLIGMNSDQEQSSGVWSMFVADYQVYKDDPANIVVHGIGGDVPRGCGGMAEPFEPFYNAANATGGAFLSICEADWTTHMTDLAAAVIGDDQTFVLTGEPAAWSIQVRVDGTRMYTGWSYDEATQEILFEDDQLAGSEIRVDYFMTADCADVE